MADITFEQLRSTNDAQVWAKAFVQRKITRKWTIDQIDEGLLAVWFSNAMMTQEDITCAKYDEEFESFISLHELARHTGLPRTWLRLQAEDNRIPCLRVGRRWMFIKKNVDIILRKNFKLKEPTP